MPTEKDLRPRGVTPGLSQVPFDSPQKTTDLTPYSVLMGDIIVTFSFPLAGAAVGVGAIPRPRSRCVSGGEARTGWPPGTPPGR